MSIMPFTFLLILFFLLFSPFFYLFSSHLFLSFTSLFSFLISTASSSWPYPFARNRANPRSQQKSNARDRESISGAVAVRPRASPAVRRAIQASSCSAPPPTQPRASHAARRRRRSPLLQHVVIVRSSSVRGHLPPFAAPPCDCRRPSSRRLSHHRASERERRGGEK
jgi:hypothetical protein